MVSSTGGRMGARLHQVLCAGLRDVARNRRQWQTFDRVDDRIVAGLKITGATSNGEALRNLDPDQSGLSPVPCPDCNPNPGLRLGEDSLPATRFSANGSLMRCYHTIQSTSAGLHSSSSSSSSSPLCCSQSPPLRSSCHLHSSSPLHSSPSPPHLSSPPLKLPYQEGKKQISSEGQGLSMFTTAAKRFFVSSPSFPRSNSKLAVEEVSSPPPPASPPPASSPHRPPSPTLRQGLVGPSEDEVRAAFAYCAEQVRKFDYENFLCALQLPRPLRAVVFALRAVNVEIATAADSLTAVGSHRSLGAGDGAHHSLASMRLLWWKEHLRNVLSGKRVEHPVMVALAAVLAETKLSRHWFTRICEARVKDLEADGPPRNIAQLEEYAESTASALLYLSLEAAGVRAAVADHVASHIGKAMCLTLLLRSTPYHSQRRRTYIPVDVAAKHGISQEEIYRCQASGGMADAVLEVASSAKLHLDKARSLRSTLPQAALPLMLPAVPIGLFLSSLEKHAFNIFENSLSRGICGGVTPLRLQVQLMWNAYRGTY